MIVLAWIAVGTPILAVLLVIGIIAFDDFADFVGFVCTFIVISALISMFAWGGKHLGWWSNSKPKTAEVESSK